jgi:DNA-binding beta-propeller fold protein YncE
MRRRHSRPARWRAVLALSVGLSALALLAAAPAQANRELLSEAVLRTESAPLPPGGKLEDACGLAVTPGGDIYVSDYYHRAVDLFALSTGTFASQIALPGGAFTGVGINGLDAVCSLALDSAGNLYANEWHRGVTRLKPTELIIDSGESTGVAVDATGDIYVDDRTYVAVYEPSGAPVEVAGQPLRIGLGSLEDAYGVAVSGGRVFVPDAGSETVKVFEPAVDPALPVAQIAHDFVSLVDAAVAVDPTNGDLTVAADPEPGWAHPGAALHEFAPSGTFLGQLSCNPVDGEPSGLAFDSAGDLYVTNGNGEGANLFKYGPYTTSAVPQPSCGAVSGVGGRAVAPAVGGSAAATVTPDTAAVESGKPLRLATASGTIQRGGVRVSLDGGISPRHLPRQGSAPVHITLALKIGAASGTRLPQLRRVVIEFNRAGRINPAGIPICRMDQIQPSTTTAARTACGRSLIGEGTFSADVRLPQQSPFPAQGKVLVFNSRYKGGPAILAHVYGSKPVPTSYTLPFTVGKTRGTYGTVLRASLPEVTGNAAAITGLALNLGRVVDQHGRRRSYVSAGCPAPSGFPSAVFPLARARLTFAGGTRIASTVADSCEARP